MDSLPILSFDNGEDILAKELYVGLIMLPPFLTASKVENGRSLILRLFTDTTVIEPVFKSLNIP